MPSRRWYLAALILVLAGLCGAALFLWPRLQTLDATLTRMVAPGEKKMTLQRGSYTVYHEYRSVVDGRYYESNDISGLRVAVRTPAGELVALRGAVNTTYNISGHSGVSLLDFDIDVPGTYTLAAAYGDRPGPEAVLAVGQGFVGRIFALILGTLAIAVASAGTGIAIASITYVKRRRAAEGKP